MKKLIFSIIAMVGLIASATAQTSYGTTSYSLDLTNGFNLISIVPTEIQQIQIVAGGTNVTVSFYDNKYGTRSLTNGAYTSILQYSTNLSLVVTNAQGIKSTNTITGGNWRTEVATDAATVTQNPNASVSAPANGIATYYGRFDFSKGVTVLLTPTNTGASLNIQSRRLY